MTPVLPRGWRRKSLRPHGRRAPSGRQEPAAPGPAPGLRTAPARYGAAAALALAAFLVERRFPAFFRPANFLLFYPCAYIAAVLGGTGPALLNVTLAAAGAFWIFHLVGVQATQPTAESMTRLACFVGFSGFGCWLIGRGRKAEVALRESEGRLRVFRALADNSSDFIGIADKDGVPVYVNPAGRALVGLSAELPLERTRIPDYYAEEARAHAAGVILKEMLERGHWKGETLFRSFRTGEAIPVWDEHFMIRDESGAVVGMGTVTRDLTERKRAEDALRRAEADLNEAQAVARLGSWRIGADGHAIAWSDETYRIFGRPLGSPLTYEDFLTLVHPDDRAEVDRAWTAALRGAPYELEHRIVVGGGTRWVHERASLQFDAARRFLGGVGTVQDVTARREAEEELAALRERERARLQREASEAATALAGSEERLRLLVQGTREYAIFMIDPDGAVTVWNEGAERIFGYKAGEVLGGSFLRFSPPDSVEQGRPQAQLRRALAEGSSVVEDWRQRRGGTRFWASIVTTPIYGPDGRHLGFGKVIRDLTEPRRAARQLEETAERLKRTVLELESFAYTISHDLRSPLRAIQGYAHFLTGRLAGSTDEESRRMLSRMSAAAQRLDRLIQDLLSYNAVARETVELAPVDLDETLAHVCGHYPEIKSAEVVVRAPLGRARGQPSLLIQVFANLLVNAAKFVPPERRPRVELWAERAGGRVSVYFQDNGIGIPRESLERVFRPFERLHPEAAYPGTGMGLAIVKRAVEKMGGSVALESEPGRGSRFRIDLEDA